MVDVQAAPAPPGTRPELPRGGVPAGLLAGMRPKQWIKQVLLFVAPAAAGVLDVFHDVLLTLAGILCFTLAAAGTYLLNDASDVDADRAHPTKRFRPMASGQLPVWLGVGVGVVLLPGSVALAAVLCGWRLSLVIGIYIVMTTAYSRYLKHVAIIELMIVAFGFVLRALAGAAAVRVPLSEWFVIVASFGSLFMVVGKRYAEATQLDVGGVASRPILREYPLSWLRQVRDVCISVTLLAYCLFAFERGAGQPHSGPLFQLSIIPVTLGLLRYALLLERGQGGAPEDVVLHDRTLLASGVVWALLFGLGWRMSELEKASSLSRSSTLTKSSAEELLFGWGRTSPTSATVTHPASVEEIAAVVGKANGRGVLARGLGRSYGDAAQNAGGDVLDMTGLDKVHSFDGDSGVIDVDAGLSLDSLMRIVVPLGWFVAVTPGTRYVTVGGAIASDIHGKNHHLEGSFAQHVQSLDLLTADGTIQHVGPDSDVFWATAGGMGLTGIVVRATLQLIPIRTPYMLVDTERAVDLDDCMDKMITGDADYRYSVAWIDLLARGSAMGRSVLTRGDHAQPGDLPKRKKPTLGAYGPRPRLGTPAYVPSNALNRATVRAFNEVWFRKAPVSHRGVETIPFFFHPLDGVLNWNRVYGRPGFLQYQFVVPDSAGEVVRESVRQLSAAQLPTFLAVLKRFGPHNRGMMSFPMAGWTLALDLPAGLDGLSAIFARLDELVASAGGRVYLSKDSRVSSDMLATMYPRLEEWRSIRARLDPERRFVSDLSRRVGLA